MSENQQDFRVIVMAITKDIEYIKKSIDDNRDSNREVKDMLNTYLKQTQEDIKQLRETKANNDDVQILMGERKVCMKLQHDRNISLMKLLIGLSGTLMVMLLGIIGFLLKHTLF